MGMWAKLWKPLILVTLGLYVASGVYGFYVAAKTGARWLSTFALGNFIYAALLAIPLALRGRARGAVTAVVGMMIAFSAGIVLISTMSAIFIVPLILGGLLFLSGLYYEG